MTSKTKKYWIIGGVAFVALLAINKWRKSLPKKYTLEEYSNLDLNTVLSKGSTGDEVLELQRILVEDYGADLGYSGAEQNGVDGEFGSLTETALMEAKGVKKISLKQFLTNK